MNTNKFATISLVALLSIALIGVATTTTTAQAQQADKPDNGKGGGGGGQQKKCNNVKIMAVVVGLDTTAGVVTLKGTATLQGQTVSKIITVNTTETSQSDGIGIPLFFKKAFQPCPALGTEYSGSVNGTTFSSTLTSISRPNLVEVDLSGQAPTP